jgi:hypothetical protein
MGTLCGLESAALNNEENAKIETKDILRLKTSYESRCSAKSAALIQVIEACKHPGHHYNES